jgi:hypothetical protein
VQLAQQAGAGLEVSRVVIQADDAGSVLESTSSTRSDRTPNERAVSNGKRHGRRTLLGICGDGRTTVGKPDRWAARWKHKPQRLPQGQWSLYLPGALHDRLFIGGKRM